MSGIELLGDIPFHDVVIHSVILDPEGQRMSKSKGNGIDPVELIDAHGADAMRYGLLRCRRRRTSASRLGPIEEGRRLANKLWNASRLPPDVRRGRGRGAPILTRRALILARIDATRAEVERTSGSTTFRMRSKRLYHLTFDDFCDWYLEAIKPRLGEPDVKATALAAPRAPVEAAASGAAARDRGDLVSPARP